MKKNLRKLIGLLSAVLAGCTMLYSVTAAAEYSQIGYDDDELDRSCINIAGLRYSGVDPRLDNIVDYNVEILNNKSGFTDIKVALYYPEELEVIPNEDDEPASEGDMTESRQTESVLDTEKRCVIFSCHSEKNNMHEGTLFSVYFRLPINAKPADKYPLKQEVLTLNNLSGELPFNNIDGYLEVGFFHDDLLFDKGDMDLSHSVSVGDAQMILKAYVNTLSGRESTLPADYMQLADIDENGSVDVADAQLLLKYCTERTALNDVTWEQLLGKVPKYPSVHISGAIFDDVRETGKQSAEK